MTQHLSVDGGTIAFDDTAGDGPLVVAVPGLGDLRSEYRFLAADLARKGYRVVTMDLRGHGESSTAWSDYTASAAGRDVIALLRHLGAKRATLIGTSFGAAAVAFAAAEEPEIVERVIVIGPFVRNVPPSPVLAAAMHVFLHGPWRVWAWLSYFDSLFPSKKPDDHGAYRAKLKANLKEPGRFEALQKMMKVDRADVDPLLGGIKAPVLVVMGSKDPDFPSPEMEAKTVAQRMNGEVLMIDGAGHYPHAEMPELVSKPVLEFLQR